MMPRPVADDRPFEIERLQQRLWNEMSRESKAHLAAGLCHECVRRRSRAFDFGIPLPGRASSSFALPS